MSTRFVTHFSSILFLHLALLFGGWQIYSSDILPALQKGTPALNLQVAKEEVPKSEPLKKIIPDKPLPATDQVAPAETQEAQAASTPASNLNSLIKADLKAIYKAELRAKIEENKFYPMMSRRLGQTGTVIVAFTLLEDGNIINIRIDSPSPFDRLNTAGLEAVKKVKRFKPIPKEIGTAKMDIKIPVKFVTI